MKKVAILLLAFLTVISYVACNNEGLPEEPDPDDTTEVTKPIPIIVDTIKKDSTVKQLD